MVVAKNLSKNCEIKIEGRRAFLGLSLTEKTCSTKTQNIFSFAKFLKGKEQILLQKQIVKYIDIFASNIRTF